MWVEKMVLFLTKDKEFVLKQGLDARIRTNRVYPKTLSESEDMKIRYRITIYVKDSEQDVKMFLEKNQRYTMRDIGRLENRIQRLEDYTTLNLLESLNREFSSSWWINGLNRFKSGFVVDNFTGHKTGDVTHKDYSCSIDYENKTLGIKNLIWRMFH